MMQDATTTKTTPSRPSISRLAYHYVGSPVVQMATTSASISVNSANVDNDDPAPYNVINLSTLFTASGTTTTPFILILAKRARARILDRWQGYAYAHLKSMGWKECGASDNSVKRATLFIQYQNAQSNHC